MSPYKNGTLPIILCLILRLALIGLVSGCQLADNRIKGQFARTLPLAVTLQFSSGLNDKTYLSSFTAEVEFNQDVDSVQAEDFSVTNGLITHISGTGRQYIIEITPSSYGPVTVSYVGTGNRLPASPVPPINIEFTRYPYPIRTLTLGIISSTVSSVSAIPGSSDQIVAGHYSDSLGSGIYLRRESLEGEVVWEKAVEALALDIQVMFIEDGVIYTAGATAAFTGSIFAYDVDTGTPLWGRAIGNSAGGTQDNATGLIRLDNGEFMYFEYSQNVTMGNRGGTVVKTDSSGVVIWHKRFDGDTANSYIWHATKSPTNEGVAIGESQGHLWFLKIDDSGSVLQNKILTPSSGGLLGLATTNAAGGGYFVSVGTGLPFGIVKLDETGEVVWSWVSNGSFGGSLRSITQLDNGTVVAAGTVTGGPGYGLVIAISPAGQFLWGKTLNQTTVIESVKETQNGALILGATKGIVTQINIDGSPIQYDCTEWSDWTPSEVAITFTSSAGPSETTSNINSNYLIDQASIQSFEKTPTYTDTVTCEP